VDLWYKERQEVLKWQNSVKHVALKMGYTKTLLGRYRSLVKHYQKFIKGEGGKAESEHGMRAAINTPIQGGAADIVIAAMVKLW